MSTPVKALCVWALLGLSVSAFSRELCPAAESTENRYDLFASPYSIHWSHDPNHRPVRLVGLSKRMADDRFCGISAFSNSFGQPSVYAYVGKTWLDPLGWSPHLYLRVTGGVIYGYVGAYKKKVPMNVGGFAPVLIPSAGWRLSNRSSVEVHVLGTAGLMWGANVAF